MQDVCLFIIQEGDKMKKLSHLAVASLLAGSIMAAPLSWAEAAENNPMEKAVVWALQIAADNSHGYSQGAENATANNPYTGSREGPDYDCSALVYHALEHAGFPIIEAWHKNPDYMKLYQGKQYSGDADTIWPDMQRIGGFTRYSWNEVKDNLKRGDILCRPEAHVAIYIGNGKTVEARGVNNPKGGDWRTGDQGGEIDCYSAYGRGWTEVYRYTGNKTVTLNLHKSV
jgi:cell wall-associated NlpC family hydrolase